MNLRYILGSAVALPLLPLMYYQGKKIRQQVPKLPEAEGVEGTSKGTNGKTLRMLTIGESTIAGVGVATHSGGFTGTLANELSAKLGTDVYWRVYARSGYTAERIRLKTLPRISESEVDLIVIGLGGNDAFTLNSPTRWKRHIRDLIADLKKRFRDVPVVFANMPPIKAFPAFTSLIKFIIGNLVEILGDELTEVVAKSPNTFCYSRKITVEDWIERLGVEAEPADFFSDGVHPSRLTYQVWARDLANFITQNPDLNKSLRQAILDQKEVD